MDPKTSEAKNKYEKIIFKAIESLLDGEISRKDVEDACSSLDVASFSDVAEERSLSNVCGYPLCSNLLKSKKWQTYSIRGNKVYDTSERRRFCSDQCYARFAYIAKQLPEEPLWFRGGATNAEVLELKFLEDETKENKAGLPGRELELAVPNDLSDCFSNLKLNDDDDENESDTSESKD